MVISDKSVSPSMIIMRNFQKKIFISLDGYKNEMSSRLHHPSKIFYCSPILFDFKPTPATVTCILPLSLMLGNLISKTHEQISSERKLKWPCVCVCVCMCHLQLHYTPQCTLSADASLVKISISPTRKHIRAEYFKWRIYACSHAV